MKPTLCILIVVVGVAAPVPQASAQGSLAAREMARLIGESGPAVEAVLKLAGETRIGQAVPPETLRDLWVAAPGFRELLCGEVIAREPKALRRLLAEGSPSAAVSGAWDRVLESVPGLSEQIDAAARAAALQSRAPVAQTLAAMVDRLITVEVTIKRVWKAAQAAGLGVAGGALLGGANPSGSVPIPPDATRGTTNAAPAAEPDK